MSNKKKYVITSLFTLCVLLLLLPIILFATQQKQTITQKADELADWDQATSVEKTDPRVAILEVMLSYDKPQNVLSLLRLSKKKGHVPTTPPIENGYHLELMQETTPVYSTVFDIPSEVAGPPPLPHDDPTEHTIERNQTSFAITIPFFSTATELRITDPNGQVILRSSMTNISEKNTSPHYRSIRGDEVRNDSSLINSIHHLFSPHAALAGGGDGMLDIAFISEGYSDLQKFHGNVTAIVSQLLTYEPYKSRAAEIRFHTIDNTVSFNCYHQDRLILCNEALVTEQVNNSGAPHDEIVVVVDDPVYGGSGGEMAMVYDGEYTPPMVAHELGHSFGGLDDEYNVETTSGEINNQVQRNCYKGLPPAVDWQNSVTADQYTLGCHFPNWYRSSPDSIMNSLTAHYYNKVSQILLNEKLDLYTSSPILSPTPTIPVAPTSALPTPTLIVPSPTFIPTIQPTAALPTNTISGTISVNPSTCITPFGVSVCDVQVTWSTNNATHARIVMNGTEIATGPSGTITAQANSGTTFTLFNGTTLLANTTVRVTQMSPSPTPQPGQPTVQPTTPPIPTATPVSNQTVLAFTLFLHGLGASGDSQSPHAGGNKTPKHTTRSVTLQFFSLSDNQKVLELPSTAIYNTATGVFQGSVIAPSLPSDRYVVKLKEPQYLRTSVITTITASQQNTLPVFTAIVGDVNNDNVINLLDYNIMRGCISVLEPAKSCTNQNMLLSDVNDDGKVDSVDRNLFIRELTNRSGD